MNLFEISFRDHFHYDTVGGQEVFVGFFVEFDNEKSEFIFAAGRQLCLVKVNNQQKQNSLRRHLEIRNRNGICQLVYTGNSHLKITDLTTGLVVLDV